MSSIPIDTDRRTDRRTTRDSNRPTALWSLHRAHRALNSIADGRVDRDNRRFAISELVELCLARAQKYIAVLR